MSELLESEILERLVVVEQQNKTMEERFIQMEKKVDEMHNVFIQGKGAKWFALALLGAWTFFVSQLHNFGALLK